MSSLSRAIMVVLTFSFTVGVPLHATAASPVITSAAGTITGVATPSGAEYLGIPYAAPPIGALRWQPPQPYEGSRTINATGLPPACPQSGSAFATSENCLFLNIYAPSGVHKRLPVMVWIPGGADSMGTADEYDGTSLASDGVIVVTINYRLGFLGFLAHPSLDGPAPLGMSGDYGLMDQQSALRWVARNIRSFGGDPTNVTVFGESAGGQGIYDQLTSPSAVGLFHKAIIESGSYAIKLPSQSDAETAGVAFADSVGCPDTTDPSCLRSLSVATILAAQHTGSTAISSIDSFKPTGEQFQPNVGPAVLPFQPLEMIALGNSIHVPILGGTNRDESRIFVADDFDYKNEPLTPSEYPAAIDDLGLAPFLPAVETFYPLSAYPSPGLADSAVFTDASFSCNERGFNELLSITVPVYAYEFADENAGDEIYTADPYMPLGASHASELPFLWPAFVGQNGPALQLESEEEVALGVTMRLAWTNFAKTGDPNGFGVPRWPRYTFFGDQVEQFVPGSSGVVNGFGAEHQCDFWEPALLVDAFTHPGPL